MKKAAIPVLSLLPAEMVFGTGRVGCRVVMPQPCSPGFHTILDLGLVREIGVKVQRVAQLSVASRTSENC